MQLTRNIYQWLVHSHILPNTGQLNSQEQVELPTNIRDSFHNGYLVAKIVQHLIDKPSSSTNKALLSVKNDNSKGIKSTNWNIVWLSFQDLNIKFDPRIKQLILQGEHALIVQILKQLYQRQSHQEEQPLAIKSQQKTKKEGSGLDLKAIDLNKSPQASTSALQFLILLLKNALNMTLENILSLFTNQNKYLAHIIVKGINDNFDPIILFYSLLLKHAEKLKSLLKLSPNDANACLYAIKPGFLSKSQAVSELTLEVFSKLQSIYEWFISAESKCINTLLLGYTRHPNLRPLFWNLLNHIIKHKISQFFANEYNQFTERPEELISITTLLLKPIAEASWKQAVIESAAITKWLSIASKFPEKDIDSQIIAFNFIAQLMLFLPSVVDENEWGFSILTKNWKTRDLIAFSTLFNQLISILQRLGTEKSPQARRIYMEITLIIRSLPKGEKRDYVLHNFALTVAKFPTIPSQNVIQNLNIDYMNSCQFLLICQSIQTTENTVTLFEIGRLIRQFFCQNPLLNFYSLTVLKQIIEKLKSKHQKINDFVKILFQEAIQRFSLLQKYKSSSIPQGGLCFGSSVSTKKIPKEEEQHHKIKLTQKQLFLMMIKYCVNLVVKGDDKELMRTVANSLIKTNAYIRQHNNKVGSKQLQSILTSRFQISEQYFRQLDQSQVKLSVTSNSSPKPSAQKKLTSQQRKFKDQQHNFQIQKQHADFQKLKSSLEFELTNVYLNSHTESVLAEDGFLELFVHPHQQTDLVLKTEMENRDIEVTQAILGKYHKVLQQIFDNYSGVAYIANNSGFIDDNAKRKQFLTAVELIKFLKDYKKIYLTSQQQVNSIVKEINLKVMKKKSLHELDFNGFQQYIVQYCLKNLAVPHQITTTTTISKANTSKSIKSQVQKNMKTLKDQPIQVLLQQFFNQLKATYISRKESITLFQDFEDIILTSEQSEQIQTYNQQLVANPQYILPKGYKKINENVVAYSYLLNPRISKIPEGYETAFSVLDQIIFQSPLNFHIIESIAEKKVISRARPITYTIKGQQKVNKQRAMSTTFDKKSSLLEKSSIIMLPNSLRSALKLIPREDRKIGEEVAMVLQEILEKASSICQKMKPQKLSVPKRKSISTAKIMQIQQKNLMLKQKRLKQKQQAAEEVKRSKKDQESKRRENIERFLQNQKQKLLEKRKRQQERKELEQQQQRQKQMLKKQNMEKFKMFHQEQYRKIKKIEEEALQRKRREETGKIQNKEREEKQRLKRSEKIKEETKLVMQIKKEAQKNLTNLFLSQSIKAVFQKHEVNIKALFEFLLSLTHKSLTQKNHNNEIVFETWRYFTSAFELSPLFMSPQDVLSIFKNYTKNKLVAKEFMAGLTFKQFQQALFRIAVKNKGYFNHIFKRIKDPQEMQMKAAEDQKKQEKEGNQFENDQQPDLEQIQQQNRAGKTEIDEFGDLSKVNGGTVKGLIYYLKVPAFKQGQIDRFKDILNKKTESAPNQNRIKQKLIDFYSLSPKKKTEMGEKKSKLRSLLGVSKQEKSEK